MLPSLGEVPIWYWIVSATVIVYQTYRGFHLQWILGTERITGTLSRVLLLCLADAWFYMLCTAFGFCAAYVGYWLLNTSPTFPGQVGSREIAAFFLMFVGLIGVTGQLPYLIQLGKFLPTGR